MKRLIAQFLKGTYEDQYGFTHDCYYVTDIREIESTERFIQWNYYSETINDRIWIDSKGTSYRAHTQTDYGPCNMPFSVLDTEARLFFYAYDPKQKRHALLPLINTKES
jgi:hypothetical protein